MKLIAETAWHHDGDFVFFKNLVTEISTQTNCDYIKFHITLDVDEYMHTDHLGYQWVKQRILTEDEWDELFQIVLKYNKKLMLLFNDKKAIDFGMKYKPELVEIHSVCLNDYKLLNFLREKINENTSIVLGIGGTDLYEVENAIQILDTRNVILMHGFQNYPTNYKDINFNKIKKIMNLYQNYDHGYADHTAWNNDNNVLITLFGAALGMNFIEKHVTNETGEGRTDWQAAINIQTFVDLELKLKLLKETFGNGLLKMNEGEKAYSSFGAMKKAAILNKSVRKGDVLSLNNFDFKRTKQHSDISQLEVLNNLGADFTSDLIKGHCINKSDIKTI